MSRRSSRPFFGILYIMVHLPFVVFWKIGITGIGIGASKRAKQIGRGAFGFPIPIFFVPIPFCYDIEQWFHRMFKGLNVVFYKGDGASEFFWFPVLFFVIPIMAVVWMGYAVLITFVFDINFSALIDAAVNSL